MTKYSNAAQKLINLLSEDDRQQIRKDNPFRIERNDKILELWNRGVSQVLLVEVTGLSSMSIWKICTRDNHKKRSIHTEEA